MGPKDASWRRWVQVLDGVKAGEEVVASALFLIDSESKLREATAKMMEVAKGGQSVGGADMDMPGYGYGCTLTCAMDDMRLDSSVRRCDVYERLHPWMGDASP